MAKNMMDLEITELSQMQLATDTGQLSLDCPVQFPGLGELTLRFRLSPEVTRQLALNLGRMQVVLEKDIEGAPPSGARH